jgi:ABC-type uncharacterized transport system substrate-binding protein
MKSTTVFTRHSVNFPTQNIPMRLHQDDNNVDGINDLKDDEEEHIEMVEYHQPFVVSIIILLYRLKSFSNQQKSRR